MHVPCAFWSIIDSRVVGSFVGLKLGAVGSEVSVGSFVGLTTGPAVGNGDAVDLDIVGSRVTGESVGIMIVGSFVGDLVVELNVVGLLVILVIFVEGV